jgi:polysaccharide export outer membrane protein
MNLSTSTKLHAVLALLALRLMLPSTILLAQDRVEPVSRPEESNAQKSDAEKSIQTTPVADVLIGEGDLLQVSLFGVPDFNEQVRVNSAGQISLPMIGQVQVRGLSPTKAGEVIAKHLKDGGYYTNPQVTVLEKEFATQGISVLGEVQKPGVYPILGPRKLFDLISAAGGTTPKAGRDITVTPRANPEMQRTVTMSDDPQKSTKANIDVYPGDTVVVSKAGVVYVVGDVRLPGGFIIDRDKDVTVLQALALAQGTTPNADLNHTKVLHKTPNGVQQTPVLLKRILSGKAEDPKLQADDILFIPHNAAKEATKRGFESVVQTATALAIYRF